MNAFTYRPLVLDDTETMSRTQASPAPAPPAPALLLPTTRCDEYVHPGAIGVALGGLGLFMMASWVGWAFGYTSLLLGVVTGLAAMYFGLLIGLGRHAAGVRGDNTRRSFREFLRGQVDTREGRVDGTDALAQIAFMPVLLGVTMLFFAVLWLGIRG